jgi:hypothetical protein
VVWPAGGYKAFENKATSAAQETRIAVTGASRFCALSAPLRGLCVGIGITPAGERCRVGFGLDGGCGVGNQ